MPSKIDYSGQRFHQLLVVKFSHIKNKKTYWCCRCDCGKEVTYRIDWLTHGGYKSCGCIRHHMRRSRFYNIWSGIVTRCFNPKMDRYADYGGRGLTLAKRWVDFKNFRDDMLDSYVNHVSLFGSHDTTIERVNNDKGYSKQNCMWVTRKQQARNKRTSRLVTFKGETLCVAEWSERLNINYGTLISRLKRGWSVKRALTTGINN